VAKSVNRVTRDRADLYATRRMVIEILRHMNESTIEKIRSSTKGATLKPEDEVIDERELRLAFDSILEEAVKRGSRRA
jgi:hypothetical protein